MNRKAVIDLFTTVALLSAAAVTLWVNAPQLFSKKAGMAVAPPKDPVDISLRTRPLEGNDQASVILVEFADAQCPFCASFARDTLPEIRTKYVDQGKVALAFVHRPLAAHPFARRAAEGVECAADQGKFWPMLSSMFAATDSGDLNEGKLRQVAGTNHLDLSRFDSCLKIPPTARVDADEKLSDALGIRATPYFYVGKRTPDGKLGVLQVISGAQPLDQFVRAIDRAISKGGIP